MRVINCFIQSGVYAKKGSRIREIHSRIRKNTHESIETFPNPESPDFWHGVYRIGRFPSWGGLAVA
ncbi:hypothetical protein [Parapedobacter tibetensis]|uniref:hypothetical protein n=1 Tax=Parapedobacter tibetensis TaxID=2972951 RepID=UPI00214D6114|nr:hypothetical protein [Parapedobacter tibetensis]